MQPVADVVQFTFVVDPAGIDEQLTTLHIGRSPGPWTGVSMFLMAEELAVLWGDNIAILTPTEASLVEVRYQDLTTLGNPEFIYVPDPAVAGTNANPFLPYVIPAVVQTFNTTGDAPARSFINQGPLREAWVEGNLITNAARVEIGAAWNAVRVGISTFDPDTFPVMVSRTLGGVDRVPPLTSVWGATSVRQTIGSRKSRLT